MNQFPDDVALIEIQPEQRLKRLEDLEFWVSNYVENVNAAGFEILKIIPGKVSYLNASYWETLEGQIRCKMLPHAGNEGRLVDRHKIASLTELTTMAAMPIETVGGDEEAQLLSNAKLAYALGLMIIGNFNRDIIQSLTVSKSFVDQHIIWLCEVKANNGFSFFSNAATWYLVEKIFKERHERLV